MATANPVHNPPAGTGGGLPTEVTYDDVAKALLVAASNSGATVSSTVSNTATTANSHALFEAKTASGGGDPEFVWTATGATIPSWTARARRSSGGRWELVKGSTVALVYDGTGLSVSTAALSQPFPGVLDYYIGFTRTEAVRSGALFQNTSTASGAGAQVTVEAGSQSLWLTCASDATSIGLLGNGDAGAVLTRATPLSTANWSLGTSNDTPMWFIATGATTGFLVVSKCSGIPTGAALQGSLVYDDTNDDLYVRTGAGWEKLTA
jgi:hypothetical protein